MTPFPPFLGITIVFFLSVSSDMISFPYFSLFMFPYLLLVPSSRSSNYIWAETPLLWQSYSEETWQWCGDITELPLLVYCCRPMWHCASHVLGFQAVPYWSHNGSVRIFPFGFLGTGRLTEILQWTAQWTTVVIEALHFFSEIGWRTAVPPLVIGIFPDIHEVKVKATAPYHDYSLTRYNNTLHYQPHFTLSHMLCSSFRVSLRNLTNS